MNTNTITPPNNTVWLRRGIAVIGTLLISGTIALGMASRAPIKVAPTAAPAASLNAARERFAALKDAQAEAHDATLVPAPVQDSGRARFAELKDAQAEAHDATLVPAAAQDSGRDQFTILKDTQAEAHDATFVPVPAQDS